MKTIIFSTVNFNKIVLMMIVFYLFSVSVVYSQDKDSTQAESDSTKTKSDSTDNKKLSLDAYPYVFYTPETEFAIGAGGILIFFAGDSSITKPIGIEEAF